MLLSKNIRDKAFLAAQDETLQKAILKACDHSSKAREEATKRLAEPEAAVLAATLARKRSVENLGILVEQLRRNLESRGIHVHLAQDAASARDLVASIIRGRFGDAQIAVVKAKTMVGEEAHLNELQSQGFSVLETDLGEFIVQLRGERPSHILAPALHLSKEQIGRLFSEKLGMAPSEDPAQITQFARLYLRKRFLEAQVGIIGVNIAVASTGFLLTLSNEGNARLCSTLPPLVIAFTSIDKVVEKPEDAAAVLRVLPRNATGQVATTYVTMLGGVTTAKYHRGNREVHLVLLDNGRSQVQKDLQLREILRCIRCGACLNICPVYRTIGGHAYGTVYPGPMGIVWTLALSGLTIGDLPYACTLCGECGRVCPVSIDLPALILRFRSETRKPLTKRIGFYVASWLLAGRTRLELFSRLLAFISQRFSFLYRVFARLFGWKRKGPVPAPSKQSFYTKWRRGLIPWPATRVRAGQVQKQPVEVQPTNAPKYSLREQFVRNFLEASGEIIECRDLKEAVERMRQILLGCRGIWAGARLAQELAQTLGLEVTSEDDATLQQAAGVDFGITDCLALIAETGSILLSHPPGAIASLLPETHVVVATANQIVERLEDALAIATSSPFYTIITGPSRTADIEKTLVMGAHGPKKVILCLFEGPFDFE